MPPKSPSAHFLGLELATDQLRASVVDEQLDLVGVQSVDFDADLPEFKTQGGIFTSPGDAYTTPVEMWVKALDLLLERLRQNFDLSKIKCIGGSAQHACVWWKNTPNGIAPFARLNPHQTIHAQLFPPSFSPDAMAAQSPLLFPHVPTSQDPTVHTYTQSLFPSVASNPLQSQHAFPQPSTPNSPLPQLLSPLGNSSLLPGAPVSAHALKLRQTVPELWRAAGRVTLTSTFLASLLLGNWAPVSESEAVSMGFYTPSARGGEPGEWHHQILEAVAGTQNADEKLRVQSMLGEIETSGGSRRIGVIARYFVDRYGFSVDTSLMPFTADYLAAYLSLCPGPSDAVLSFGPMDTLLMPLPSTTPPPSPSILGYNDMNSLASHDVAASNSSIPSISPQAATSTAMSLNQYMAGSGAPQVQTPKLPYAILPHPAQALEQGEKRRWIALLMSRNGDVPRALVRDMYTKSWSAFDRLVAIVPPGGSIGLDDKLFSFWFLQPEAPPFASVKGIFRFETGIKAGEFRDLRANPRCLLESQVLSFRTRYARMLSALTSTTSQVQRPSNPYSSGVSFDPYSANLVPRRIVATGAAANFPSIVNLLGDAFNAPVFVPVTQLESAHSSMASVPSSGAGSVPSTSASTPPPTHSASLGGQMTGLPSTTAGPSPALQEYTSYGSAAAHRNAPAPGFPSRAALGAAYMARWAWGRERSASSNSTFEDDVKRLLIRKWNISGGSSVLIKKGLGNGVLVEEEEDEEGNVVASSGLDMGGSYASLMNNGMLSAAATETANSRSRTLTNSSTASYGSAGTFAHTPSTAFTSPDPTNPSSLSMQSPGGTGSNAAAPPGVTPLTPVSAMPTGDAEAQLGWLKVAEPDPDAFMAYASIIPEFVRLEGLLLKSIV